MRKTIFRIALLATLPLLGLSSCIKSELPNVDADIVDVILDKDVVVSKKIENDRITIFVTPGSYGDRTYIKPTFILSEGSSIVSGADVTDYSKANDVVVVSEDGNWTKSHKVQILDMLFPTEYYFENWEENRGVSGVYDDCYERVSYGEGIINNLYIWASGNLGYRITGLGKNPYDYPTYKTLSPDDAHNGAYAAVLETRYVGKIGQGSPLAAGNLFVGEFSGKDINIMKEQMKATRFGIPFNKIPSSLKVWFKYKSAGEINIYNANGEITGIHRESNGNTRDYAAIYVVMFDNRKAQELYNGQSYLNGATILSSPAEVGRALLDDDDKYGTDGAYVFKDIEFKLKDGVTIDPARLANYEYSIAIVFSSSFYGASFWGAPGSKLWVDDVVLECEE